MQDNPYNCEHPKTELRHRTYSNGSTHYVDQCLRCGRQLRSYKHNSREVAQAKLNGTIPDFDQSLSDLFCELAHTTYADRRSDNREGWLAWYDEYLKSPAWASKRTAVLRRDQHICQGCRERRATQVHHISYRNVGNELLFQLTSLCQQCHDRIHQEHSNDNVSRCSTIQQRIAKCDPLPPP